MAKQKKWQVEIPCDVETLIEDVDNVTLEFVIEQYLWVLEQAGGDTLYGDEDEGVAEVARFVRKYRRYIKS